MVIRSRIHSKIVFPNAHRLINYYSIFFSIEHSGSTHEIHIVDAIVVHMAKVFKCNELHVVGAERL